MFNQNYLSNYYENLSTEKKHELKRRLQEVAPKCSIDGETTSLGFAIILSGVLHSRIRDIVFDELGMEDADIGEILK